MCRRLIEFGLEAEEIQGGKVATFPCGIISLKS
jgi:hypothetical protein